MLLQDAHQSPLSVTPDMIDRRLRSEAAARNREPILSCLRAWLPAHGEVLEIASGTGEHIVHLARALPHLDFQPSDPDSRARASIDAWVAESGVGRVKSAMALDTTRGPDWPAMEVAAVVCINMIHISPWTATLGLMRGAAAVLNPGGVLYLYGPYRRNGEHTAPSNAAFDASLRVRDPDWGIRDLEAVVAAAAAEGLSLAATQEMPANNLSVIFRR